MIRNLALLGALFVLSACMTAGDGLEPGPAARVVSMDRAHCDALTETAQRRHGICAYQTAAADKAAPDPIVLDLRCEDLHEHVAARLPECRAVRHLVAAGNGGGANGAGPGNGPGNGAGNGPGNGPGNGAGPGGGESSSASAGPGGASASASMGGSGGESSSASAGPGGASASASMGGH